MRQQLRPLFDQVVIKELDPDRVRRSGLVLPPGEHESPPQHGIVLAVGPGLDWWGHVGGEMPLEPGDHGGFPASAGGWGEGAGGGPPPPPADPAKPGSPGRVSSPRSSNSCTITDAPSPSKIVVACSGWSTKRVVTPCIRAVRPRNYSSGTSPRWYGWLVSGGVVFFAGPASKWPPAALNVGSQAPVSWTWKARVRGPGGNPRTHTSTSTTGVGWSSSERCSKRASPRMPEPGGPRISASAV